MKRLALGFCMLALLAASPVASVHAQDGYNFELSLTTPDARHDPDGIWSDDDLAFYRSQEFVPKIYTARLTTPAGRWLLSQTNGDCNMQGMCTTLLYFQKNGEAPRMMASAQVQEGGSAVLSLNYKKLTTTEINQNGQPFVGSYEVDAIK